MPRFAANLTMMFTEVPFLERFQAARKAGFRAVEFQRPYAWPEGQVAAAALEADVKCVLINTPSGDWDAGERGIACLPGREEEFRQGVELALRYGKALGVHQLHATAGIAAGDLKTCEAMYIDNLRWAARCAQRERLVDDILIEPISQVAFPGYFLNTLEQARDIIDRVAEPNVRLQADCYHVQMEQGNVARRLREFLPLIGHIQIAGVPDRHEPDTGELRYEYLFALLNDLDYQGWVGCEYNPAGETVAGLTWFKPWRERA